MKKIMILLITFSLLFTSIFTVSVAEKTTQHISKENKYWKFTKGYTNLTVNETWELIKTDDNGIQYLIDVRTREEYINERISTPSIRERPRLFPLQWLEQENLLNSFKKLYKDKEIILYCRSANRSCIAANLLVENNFKGKIYNMQGGIKTWKRESLPVVKGLIRSSHFVNNNNFILRLFNHPFFVSLIEKINFKNLNLIP